MTARSSDQLTWRALWAETAAVLGSRAEARWLCERASSASGDEFLGELDTAPTERMVAHLDAMLARYRSGEPLQYVLGGWAFRRLDLMVDPRVLIPRPETELVVEVALERVRRTPGPWRAADLGTGSGAIGLSLAAELPLGRVEVWLTDASPDALHVARANLAGLGRAGAGVQVAEGDWYGALPPELRGTFDLIVSNPPYVVDGDPELEPSVLEWEPAGALLAGADGLEHVRAIVAGAGEWLVPHGWLVLEIGHQQGPAVAQLMAAAGLVEVEVLDDLAGRPRVAVSRSAP